MIPLDQPKLGEQGNCFIACIASILEVDIPETTSDNIDKDLWTKEILNWLEPYNLTFVDLTFKDGELFNLEGCYIIADGYSSRGILHSCVAIVENARVKIVHDPHPSREGLKEIAFITCLVRKG